DYDVSRSRLVRPASSFREIGFGVGAKFLDGPAFCGIGTDVDSVIGEELEVSTAVGLRCRIMKLVESVVDRRDRRRILRCNGNRARGYQKCQKKIAHRITR